MKQKNRPNPLILDLRPVQVKPKKKSMADLFHNKRIVYAVIALTVLILAAWLLTPNNTSPGQKELNEVKAQVSKLMLLPTDEEPTLALVEDKNKLSDPYLKEKSKDGDQLLIYTNNQIVIIYRPSINKIAAVGSVESDPAMLEAQNATVSVLNGSSDDSKTKKVINDIKAAYPELNVVDGGSTNRQDFPTTIVIDNSNDKDNLLLAISDIIAGKKGVVPLGEAKASSDIQIIVGKD